MEKETTERGCARRIDSDRKLNPGGKLDSSKVIYSPGRERQWACLQALPFLSLPSRLQSDRREKRNRDWLIRLKQGERNDGEEKPSRTVQLRNSVERPGKPGCRHGFDPRGTVHLLARGQAAGPGPVTRSRCGDKETSRHRSILNPFGNETNQQDESFHQLNTRTCHRSSRMD